MGLLIALLVLAALAALPLGIRGVYDQHGAQLHLLVGPLRFQLYPRRRTDEKPPKEEQRQSSQKGTPARPAGGSFRDFQPLIQAVLELLAKLRSRLRVKRLEMKLILAADDPCDLALAYGRAWVAVGNLIPQLERFLMIQKRDIQVECDFTGEETKLLARADVTITLGRLTGLLMLCGTAVVREYLKFMKLRKGGTKL